MRRSIGQVESPDDRVQAMRVIGSPKWPISPRKTRLISGSKF